MIEVKLTISPEKGQVNEPITFEAKVTQGEENVEDADEVNLKFGEPMMKNMRK